MDLRITSYCLIRDNRIVVNDRLLFYQENILTFADFLKSAYKQEQVNYPKFFKMDAISKLGFLATELVLKEATIAGYDPDAVGVILSNSSSCLDTDIAHQDTIKDRSGYFPSPSVFVYTLPNIVIGEICIRNKIKGENAFLISESFNAELLCDYAGELFVNKRVDACLCGWIEVLGDRFNALVSLVEKTGNDTGNTTPGFRSTPFTPENLKLIMTRN